MAPKRKCQTGSLESSLDADRKHIRFAAEDTGVNNVDSRSNNAERSSTAAGHLSILTVQSQAAVSASEEAYVLDLAVSCTNDTVVAASDRGLHAYEFEASRMSSRGNYSGIKGPVTAVKFAPRSSNSVYACGGGGDVVCWDIRANEASQRYNSAPPDMQLDRYLLRY